MSTFLCAIFLGSFDASFAWAAEQEAAQPQNSTSSVSATTPSATTVAPSIAPARPGAKNEEGVKPAVTPLDYPDLSPCIDILNDLTLYKGSHKILKKIEPGIDGWLFRTADFRTDFTMSEKAFNYMKRLNAALKKRDIDLYIVIQPTRAMLMHKFIDPKHMPEGYDPEVAKKNFKGLVSQLNGAGITTIDLSDIPSDLVYFFKGDPHWRREGAYWSAEQVSNTIMKNPRYAGIKKDEFSTEITWWLESEIGEFDEYVEEMCKVKIPPERRPMWATTSLSSSGISEDALFGEATYPDVAIVGTSNTAHEEDFNFVGSLKKTLHTDIRNKAISAGAFSGSSLLFYSTTEFKEHPPKILIWEFLAHHHYEDFIGFRQMLPAIEGGCTDKDALASITLPITLPPDQRDAVPTNMYGPFLPGQTFVEPDPPPVVTSPDIYGPIKPAKVKKKVKMYEIPVFKDLHDKHIKSQDSYLMIDVTKPEIRNLGVGVLYANGDAEELDISRSRRAENEGRYFLEFNDDIPEELMLVQIVTDKPQGEIKARICKRNKDL